MNHEINNNFTVICRPLDVLIITQRIDTSQSIGRYEARGSSAGGSLQYMLLLHFICKQTYKKNNYL